ncbi:hypothetical protein [Nocardia thailandica]|uniref:hypothetical protein n=1 Tax=Nocardia thailandica TaxID=257275 RepID=UPI0002FCA49D|nr:hypothetical protein [Nocardia thailandica]
MAAKKIVPTAKSRWATMRDEARANRTPREPYAFDAVDPPILITAPDTVERATALAEMIDAKGGIDSAHLRRLIAAICGDAYERVWEIIRDEPAEVLFALISDMNEHFNAVPGDEAGDLPGGE